MSDDVLISDWMRFLEGLHCNVFFTSTYGVITDKPGQPGGNRVKGIAAASSGELAIDRTKRLLVKILKPQGFRVRAFLVAEQHKSGTYHSHGMLQLETNPENLLQLCKTLQGAFDQAYGFSRFQPVRDSEDVRRYVSKYLTKSIAEWAIIGHFAKVGECEKKSGDGSLSL